MKPVDHYRTTAAQHGRLTGAAAVLPDIGVVLQRAPSRTVRRWGATLHHSPQALALTARVPVLGDAWKAHHDQDERTHPAGTYGPPEAAGLPPKVTLLYSGGPDAFITWRLLGKPHALYVAVGNTAHREEVSRVHRANDDIGPIDVHEVPPMNELGTGWVPYRNLVLILAAAQHSPDVVMARIAEWGPDKNPRFFRSVERVLASSRGGHFQAADGLPRVRIHTPFAHLTKTRLVRRYIDAFAAKPAEDPEADLARYTWSCYGPGPRYCGRCSGCWSRWVAWHNNGLRAEDSLYELRPVRGDFTARLHPGDFRPSMVPVYVKRYMEMRGHE